MQPQAHSSRSGDGTLWLAALAMALLLNILLLLAVGFTMLETAVFRRQPTVTVEKPKESVATIFAQLAESKPAEPPTSAERQFARTSDDQIAPPSENPAFIGERNTQATSERAPDAAAPPLPSQAGIDRDDLETTTSNYQDGSLDTPPTPAVDSETAPMPEPTPAVTPQPAQQASQPSETTATGEDTTRSTPPPAEKLLSGPNPVDIAIPKPATEPDEIKPTPEQRPTPTASATPEVSEIKPSTKPAKPVNDPAFRGNQRKSAIFGSISRTGRSALDVEDSPLGRYEAAISRAVEQEWQRNCMRHRDLIVPGYLTVRFFVLPTGKVKSVQFVGDMETGEVQKGFTYNSIREAAIPPMPPALRKDYEKEPLELIFRFYF